MHLSPSTLVAIPVGLLITLLPTATNAQFANNIKVNYYSDTNCQNYQTSVFPFVNGNCYDYNWTGQQSIGIAECNFQVWGCQCHFYAGAGCTGSIDVFKKYKVGSYCTANPGGGYKSMRCSLYAGE
ncbi:hypothetical protein QBC37DRAFT_293966 [Rhypophila decipiens]|uniref:Uncharacterized protein n=1 Tax=Rhypophila decipiens TaxID=261697 RepID=A0AAN6Y021_9PEZI|nr:hypothetical protein QBC37DRAFT_293966 [Rhypophila decipiens]